MSEEEVAFQVTEEVTLTDLDAVKETRSITPKAQGVRVSIEKAQVRKALEDNSKDAVEGPENRVAYKYLNVTFKLLDGISVPVYDDNGNQTGETEIKYKNKVIFNNRMDLIFWHNPEVKTTNWWKNLQYIFGFKGLCQALGFNLKEVRINDNFLEELKGKELLLDITHEEEQEMKDGKWVGKGTFRERLNNFKAWS